MGCGAHQPSHRRFRELAHFVEMLARARIDLDGAQPHLQRVAVSLAFEAHDEIPLPGPAGTIFGFQIPVCQQWLPKAAQHPLPHPVGPTTGNSASRPTVRGPARRSGKAAAKRAANVRHRPAPVRRGTSGRWDHGRGSIQRRRRTVSGKSRKWRQTAVARVRSLPRSITPVKQDGPHAQGHRPVPRRCSPGRPRGRSSPAAVQLPGRPGERHGAKVWLRPLRRKR